jgi:hypothetical protein
MGSIEARLSRLEKQLSPASSREQSSIDADLACELLKLLPNWPRDLTAAFEAAGNDPGSAPMLAPVTDDRHAEIVAECRAIREQIDAGTIPPTFEGIMLALPAECVNELTHHGGR